MGFRQEFRESCRRSSKLRGDLTRRWMEKRQKRILNQNGMQALSSTHGMNIVVGYFTRQQPHDFEFAMHTIDVGGAAPDGIP